MSLMQMFGPNEMEDRYSGIRALWLKVIIRAVFDWVTYRDSIRLEQKKIADKASSWLFDPIPANSFFNSFENICDQLGLSSADVRAWANSMTKDQVTKIEHLDRATGMGGNTAVDTKILLSGIDRPEEVEEDLI